MLMTRQYLVCFPSAFRTAVILAGIDSTGFSGVLGSILRQHFIDHPPQVIQTGGSVLYLFPL